jgi:hypothetical protein
MQLACLRHWSVAWERAQSDLACLLLAHSHLHTKTSFGSGLNARQRCSVFELVMGSTGKTAGPAASSLPTAEAIVLCSPTPHPILIYELVFLATTHKVHRHRCATSSRSTAMALQRQRAAAAASEEAVRHTLLLVPNTMHTSVFLLECAACEHLGVQCSTELTRTYSDLEFERPCRAHFLCGSPSCLHGSAWRDASASVWTKMRNDSTHLHHHDDHRCRQLAPVCACSVHALMTKLSGGSHAHTSAAWIALGS